MMIAVVVLTLLLCALVFFVWYIFLHIIHKYIQPLNYPLEHGD